MINEYDTPENYLLQRYRAKILQSLYHYQGTRIKFQIKQSPEINNFIRMIEGIYPSQIFQMQETTTVKVQLL